MPKVIDSEHPVGEFRAMGYVSVIPDGWKLANGSTIGSAASGAASADAYNYYLFIHLWNNYTNTQLVIQTSGGSPTTRGASADADWTANKRMPLPNMNGRIPIGKGGAFTFGNSGGMEKVLLSANETGIPAHAHSMGFGSNDNGNNVQGVERWMNYGGGGFNSPHSTHNNSAVGASASHENMPPYTVISWMISY